MRQMKHEIPTEYGHPIILDDDTDAELLGDAFVYHSFCECQVGHPNDGPAKLGPAIAICGRHWTVTGLQPDPDDRYCVACAAVDKCPVCGHELYDV